MNKFFAKILIFAIIFSLTAGGFDFTAFAAFNAQINYQGKLTNVSNVAVADGDYNIEFKLYTAPTGGAAIWTETRTGADTVAVTSGLFSVMLGEVSSLSAVNFNQTLYLGVNIGGTGAPSWDGEMTPRKKLGAVPAAFESDKVDGLSSEQFLRADAANSTSTASTFLTVTQNGAGNIADFLGPNSSTAMTVLSGGKIGIGTTSPYAMLSVAGETVASHFTATSTTATSTFAGGMNVAGTSGLTVLQNGNVGFGTVSPLTKLHIVGGDETEVAVSATADGQQSRFGFYESADSKDGFRVQYDGSANALKIFARDTYTDYQTRGLTILRNSGNVGIGTTSPAALLSVAGDTYMTGGVGVGVLNTVDNSLRIQNGVGVAWGGNLPEVFIENNGTSPTSYAFGINTGTGNIMAVTNTGNVGIGTTSPYARLSVVGQTVSEYFTATSSTASTFPYASTTALTVSGSTYLGSLTGALQAINGLVSATSSLSSSFIEDVYLRNDANDTTTGQLTAANFVASSATATSTFAGGLAVETSGLVYDYSSGRVGIGTAAPNALLTINHSGNPMIRFQDGGTNLATIGDGDSVITGGGTTDFGISAYGSGGGLLFGISSSEKMRIANSGNVGIGTTSPYAKLTVWGGGTGTGQAFEIVNNASSTLLSVLDSGVFQYKSAATSTIIDNTNYAWTIATSSSAEPIFKIDTRAGNKATTTITGGLVVDGGAINYDYSAGITTIDNLQLGAINFDTDAGMISWTDMPVTANAATGTVESYTANIDGNPLLTVYSESDGMDGIQNSGIGIGTTSPYSRLTVWGGGTGMGQLFEIANNASTTLAKMLDNGTMYFSGSVGIGTSSPYTSLAVAGSTGVLANVFSATSTAATSTFAGGLTVGTTTPKRFIVDAYTGAVLIGTDHYPRSNPAKLTISNGAAEAGQYTGIELVNNGATVGDEARIDFAMTSSAIGGGARIGVVRQGGNAASDMYFSTNHSGAVLTERMRLTYAGRVGIGTTTPNWMLQLASTTPFLTLSDTSAGLNSKHWFMTSQGGNFYVGTSTDALNATSTYLTINKGGNVGIGTTSPYAKLSVAGETVAEKFTATSTTATSTFAGGLLSTGAVELSRSGDATTGDFSVTGTFNPTMYFGRLSSTPSDNTIFKFRTRLGINKYEVDLGAAGDINGNFENTGGGSFNIQRVASGNNVLANLFTVQESTGNVGIGTTSPLHKLSVAGFVNTDGTVGGYKIDNNTVLQASSTSFSTLVGSEAGLALLSDGLYNTAIGYQALYSATSTDYNTAVGYRALYLNTTGQQNTANGYGALYYNTTGSTNTANGYLSLHNNTSASNNIAIGSNTLFNTTTGGSNIGIGNSAINSNTTGTGNVGMGFSALYSGVTGASNVAVGNNALYANITGGSNTAIGNEAMRYNGSATNTTAVGFRAGLGVSGQSVFQRATLLGYQSGLALTTGNNNVFLGYQSGDAVTAGSNNIVIGYDLDTPDPDSSNTLNIGSLIFGNGINGTGTTVSSGNISIGTSSPWARLAVQGNLGSMAPIFDVASTTSSAFATSSLFRINADGSIGIGTTSPATTLSVQGDTLFSGTLFAGGTITSTSSLTASNIVASSASATSTFAGGLAVETSGLVYDYSSGRVGIGTAAPGVKFDVIGAIRSDGYVYGSNASFINYRGNGNNNINFYSDSGYDLIFNPGGTERLRMANSGLVGIGTSSPYAKLSVWGGGTDTGQLFELTNSASTTLMSVKDNGSIIMGSASAGNIIFDTSASGSVVLMGLGTTTPDADLTIVSNQPSANTYLFTIATTTGDVVNRRFAVDSSGNVTYDGALSSPADYAEAFGVVGKKSEYEPGDVVSLSTSTPGMVEKSKEAYQGNLLGVYSTKPGIIGTLANDITDYKIGESNDIPVGMMGRVPVKVSLEGGAIKAGDRITSSPVPGVGMKATTSGMSIGVALENFDGSSIPAGQNIGKVMVLLDTKNSRLSVGEDPWAVNMDKEISQIKSDLANLKLLVGSSTASVYSGQSQLDASWFGWILGQFSNIGVKIADGIIIIKEMFADKVTTKQLCLEDVCVDKNQLKELLQKNGVTQSQSSSLSLSSSSSSYSSASSSVSSMTTTATTTQSASSSSYISESSSSLSSTSSTPSASASSSSGFEAASSETSAASSISSSAVSSVIQGEAGGGSSGSEPISSGQGSSSVSSESESSVSSATGIESGSSSSSAEMPISSATQSSESGGAVSSSEPAQSSVSSASLPAPEESSSISSNGL